jgi:hypothetical protein
MNLTITAAARTLICAQLARYRPRHAALLVTRQAASGELTRGPGGEAIWRIDRPRGWEANVVEIRDAGSARKSPLCVPVTSIAGIPVVFERYFAASLHVRVRNGRLHVFEAKPDARQ